MSYTPTVWANGDTITATKLNKIENGIADAGGGGGGVLVVTDTDGTLDATWQEIHDAGFSVVNYDNDTFGILHKVGNDGAGTYFVSYIAFMSSESTSFDDPLVYNTNSASGYPEMQ